MLPAYVPTTLFSLNQNQWMLSEYFGGSLPENADNLLWRGAFSQFAKLQIESTRHISELISNGCLQRSITDLPALLSEILNDLDITSSLPVKVSTHKNNLIVTVTNYIEELQQFALSDTLVHGDLHIENIAQQNNDFIFFDWSDACISHPFIDGTYIYRMPDSVEKQNIIEAYLTPWLYLADMATLKRAWSKAELVCYAHQAISYASMKKTLSNEQMKDLEQVYLNAFNRLVNFSCLADPNNHADEFIT
ncbi:phosphotransferase [Shewanella sp. MBTL60-112-B1]|uniref:phosphotransferase n=1 Tax=Shewanella sp. MBTL60-112-B1 TaxID=2815916 RepID=UPI001C7D5754|nr:phosphotransferase [Shewanella sp. MBTL60-112-B1]